MLFLENLPWQRYVPWMRVALAAASLGSSLLWPGQQRLVQGLLLVFLIYSILPALRVMKTNGTLGLLALFGDTVYFLILASFGAERLLWMPSLFYLYLLGEALAFYTAAQLVVVAGVCAAFCAAFPDPGMRLLEPTVVVAGAVACAFGIHKRDQNTTVQSLTQKLKAAVKEAEKARDDERQRIASDFHDGPLQSFISLQMRLEILRKLLDRDAHAGMEDLRQLQALAQSQIRDLRAFLHSMRPVDVDGANLVATARRTAESFQKESGIPVTFLGSATPVGLPQESSSEVLQMLKESLHNVQKHAGATRVAVAMEKTDRGLEISVDDNGHGFNFAGTYNLEELELLRLGPASLKRRARSLNADLLVESRPGRGAGLKFRIPLQ